MNENVIASVQLGWLVAGAVSLVLAGLLIGWSLNARRFKNLRPGLVERAGTLIQALPQAALLAGADGQVLALNPRAESILAEFAAPAGLPAKIGSAIERCVRLNTSETLEASPAESPNRRFQVLVTPLAGAERTREALVIFLDLAVSDGRANFSQRLTGALAHELRTPLTAILGHIEILSSCGIGEEDLWRRSLGFVSSEADRLARLVEDLLNLARLERAPLYLGPVDLRQLAEEAVSALRFTADKNQTTFALQAPLDLPCVQADADRLRQVWINLLENAIKYAPGSTITVQMSCTPNLVHVRVQDNGPGISAADLPHIFEPFFRNRQPAARERGTGLGLTIVQAILEQHHAPIQAHSNLGEGASFTFSLPVASPQN